MLAINVHVVIYTNVHTIFSGMLTEENYSDSDYQKEFKLHLFKHTPALTPCISRFVCTKKYIHKNENIFKKIDLSVLA